jgi:hypothetical protein
MGYPPQSIRAEPYLLVDALLKGFWGGNALDWSLQYEHKVRRESIYTLSQSEERTGQTLQYEYTVRRESIYTLSQLEERTEPNITIQIHGQKRVNLKPITVGGTHWTEHYDTNTRSEESQSKAYHSRRNALDRTLRYKHTVRRESIY